MKPEYAQALLKVLEGSADKLLAACEEIAPDGGEALAKEIASWLSQEAGTDEPVQEEAQ